MRRNARTLILSSLGLGLLLSACAAESKLDPATNAEIRAIRAQSVQGDKRLLFPGERTVYSLPDGNPLWLMP